jgi:hypothetical protein
VERRIRLAIGRGFGGVGGLGGRLLQDVSNLIGIDFIYHRSIVFSFQFSFHSPFRMILQKLYDFPAKYQIFSKVGASF